MAPVKDFALALTAIFITPLGWVGMVIFFTGIYAVTH
jgi:hypothetical protein